MKRHRVVVIENLRVKAMMASARGTAEEPGRNVAAKAGLNRSILDKGWGEMRRQLAYKLSWSGRRLIAVDPRNTSRTCGCCGIVDAASRIDRDRFSCWSCGYQEHADTNAARVIRQRGLLSFGISEESRPERSWQPEEPAPAMRREEKNDGISRQGVLA